MLDSKRVLLAVVVLLASPLLVDAEEGKSPSGDVLWVAGRSPYKFATFDCARHTTTPSRIVVRGVVELHHPYDKSDSLVAPEITVRCDRVFFESGSKLLTRAGLSIRAEQARGGAIVIKSNRGAKGVDALKARSLPMARRRTGGQAVAAPMVKMPEPTWLAAVRAMPESLAGEDLIEPPVESVGPPQTVLGAAMALQLLFGPSLSHQEPQFT